MRFKIPEWKWEDAKKRFPSLLPKVNQKRFPGLLIATVQNLRKLLRHLSQNDPELVHRIVELHRRLSMPVLSRFEALLPS